MTHWQKLVSRTENVLHWDSSVSMRREPLRVGPVWWGTRNDLVIKGGKGLPTWYENNPPIAQQTNLGDFVGAISQELDAALDVAIAVIDRDLQAVAGQTREDARALYERFRLDMGLMLFGLVCNAIPVERIQNLLGERFLSLEEGILRPHRPTLLGREARAIFASQKESNGKTDEWFAQEAKRLADTFGFVHSEYESEQWSAADYEAALRGPQLAVAEVPPLDEQAFDSYEGWLVSVIQKLSYLHDEGKSALVRTNWALRHTLKHLGYGDRLLRLSEAEFRAWADTGALPSDDELELRKDYFAILSQGDSWRFFFGKDEVDALIRKEELLDAGDTSAAREIRGSIASKGTARGRVKIVFTQEDSKALQEGDILVASMTTPAYIDAMRRASAYVTDEGGTICHAAIIAREFKKPCIVGTRAATQVLKDGDLVEVDANAGIVHVL